MRTFIPVTLLVFVHTVTSSYLSPAQVVIAPPIVNDKENAVAATAIQWESHVVDESIRAAGLRKAGDRLEDVLWP